MGDAVMAIFGAPFSYGDDADRAVLAAIDMVRRVQEMKAAAQKSGKKAFDVGIGINTGHAIAGNVGNLDRMDYTVIGDMVNTAFRLTSTAKRNQILISKETRKAIQRKMDFKDMGRIKAKDLEIEAFEVVVPPVGKSVSTLQLSEAQPG
jgi:adenylate cyclase